MFHVEHKSNFLSILKSSAASLDIQLDNDQATLFEQYLEHLKSWNCTTNLTSINSDSEITIKHFIDSIAALNAEHFPNGCLVFDVGTGAGFPGIPLKIVRPDIRLKLIEPVKKKSSFLRYIVGTLHLEQVEIFDEPLEEFTSNLGGREKADYVTARGIKFEFILELSETLLKQTGKTLLFLSNPIDVKKIPSYLSVDHELSFNLPLGYGKRVISVIRSGNSA